MQSFARMKHAGLFAFGLTTCVLVPTALHVLSAGPAQVAKLVAPPTSEITLNGAQVALSSESAILGVGQKLHVTVTAKAAQHTKVRVALLAYEASGTGGGRIETPPRRIGRGEVTLDVKSGEAKQTFAFTLPGDAELNMNGPDSFTHYRVLAMSPEEADQFDRLRRRADRVADPMENPEKIEGFMDTYRSAGLYDDEEGTVVPHTVGRLDVMTPAKGQLVKLSVPDRAKVGDDIEVVVTVANKSKKPVTGLTVRLGTASMQGLPGEYLGLPDESVGIADDKQAIDIAPASATKATFHVKASQIGTLGLAAMTGCESEGCYDVPGLVDSVALDAIEIGAADHPPQVVDL